MYNFMFYFFYCYYERFKDFSPRFSAICAVVITQFIHVFLGIALIKYLFSVRLPRLHESVFWNKLFFIPFGIMWIIIVYKFYSLQKTAQIINQQKERINQPFSIKNIIIVIMVIALPLALAIVFMKL